MTAKGTPSIVVLLCENPIYEASLGSNNNNNNKLTSFDCDLKRRRKKTTRLRVSKSSLVSQRYNYWHKSTLNLLLLSYFFSYLLSVTYSFSQQDYSTIRRLHDDSDSHRIFDPNETDLTGKPTTASLKRNKIRYHQEPYQHSSDIYEGSSTKITKFGPMLHYNEHHRINNLHKRNHMTTSQSSPNTIDAGLQKLMPLTSENLNKVTTDLSSHQVPNHNEPTMMNTNERASLERHITDVKSQTLPLNKRHRNNLYYQLTAHQNKISITTKESEKLKDFNENGVASDKNTLSISDSNSDDYELIDDDTFVQESTKFPDNMPVVNLAVFDHRLNGSHGYRIDLSNIQTLSPQSYARSAIGIDGDLDTDLEFPNGIDNLSDSKYESKTTSKIQQTLSTPQRSYKNNDEPVNISVGNPRSTGSFSSEPPLTQTTNSNSSIVGIKTHHVLLQMKTNRTRSVGRSRRHQQNSLDGGSVEDFRIKESHNSDINPDDISIQNANYRPKKLRRQTSSATSDTTHTISSNLNESRHPSKDPSNNLDPLYVLFRDRSRFWIQRVLVPILTVVGLFGNSITIIIMTRRRMRSTTNLYLAALAFVDMLYLVLTFVLGLSHYPNMASKKYYYYWSMKPFLMMLTDSCSNTSVWLTVTFTIERYIAVRFPIQGKVWCTEARAKALIAGVFIFGIAFASPVPFEWRVVERRPQAEVSQNQNTTKFVIIKQNMTAQPSQIERYESKNETILSHNDYGDANNAISQSIAETSIKPTVISATHPDDNARSNIEKYDETMSDGSGLLKHYTNNQGDLEFRDKTNSTNLDERGVTLALDYSEFGENDTYKTCYYWSTAVIFYFIPFISLMFFNGYLIKSVHQSGKQRNKMTNQPRKRTLDSTNKRAQNKHQALLLSENNLNNHQTRNNSNSNDGNIKIELSNQGRIQSSTSCNQMNELSCDDNLISNGKPIAKYDSSSSQKGGNFIMNILSRLSSKDKKSNPYIEGGDNIRATIGLLNSQNDNNHRADSFVVGVDGVAAGNGQYEVVSSQVIYSNPSRQIANIGPNHSETLALEPDSAAMKRENKLLEVRETGTMSISSRDSSSNNTNRSPLNSTRNQTQQQRANQNQNHQPHSASTQERRITIMLISVVILFLVCQIPSAAMIIYTSVNAPEPNTNEQALVLAFGNIFNFLMAVNAAGNFVLYSFLSQKYRRTFVQLFCPCLKSSKILKNEERNCRNSRAQFNSQRAYRKNYDRSFYNKSSTEDSGGGQLSNTALVSKQSSEDAKSSRTLIVQQQVHTKEQDKRMKQRAGHQFDDK